MFANPDRVHAVCRDIVDHYLAGAYRNGLKAQVVAFNRELAVAYTDTINELLAGFETSQVLAEVGRHERITAEVNISVSDSKDEDPAMRPYRMTETQEEEQKRRFLTPDDPLCFLVVTAKLMTGFDAPNEGVLYLDKPLKAHTLFQTITRPNRTWDLPGRVREDLRRGRGLHRPGRRGPAGRHRPHRRRARGRAAKGGGFVTDLSDLVAEFRAAFARIEDLLVGVDGLDLTVHGYESVRAINDFLDANPAAAEAFARDYRLLARLYPLISTDTRVAKYRDGFGLFGSVYTTLFKKSSDEERKERLAELGPMVLEIINAHVHSFTVVASQEEPLVLDAQGISILKELLALVRPKASPGDEAKAPPSAAEILDAIKAALDEGVEPGSAKYTALAERMRQLRNRIIQNAQDALDFLAEALQVARTVVDAARNPDQAVVMDEDHVGVLSRIIRDHAPEGLTVTERNLAEEIDQVVTRTLARPWDNADARSRGVRRATAAVFRRYTAEAGRRALRLDRRLHRSPLPR